MPNHVMFTLRSGLHGLSLAAAIFAIMASLSSAKAACVPSGQELPSETVSKFLADPNSILGSSGDNLTFLARDLAASNPATLAPLVALLKNATQDEQRSIGSGLGQAAAVLCIRTDPIFAADIQQQVAASLSDSAKQSFAAITGNNPISATGAGAGASPGGVGGDTGAPAARGNGTGTASLFGPEGTQNNGANYFTGGVTGISGISTTARAGLPTSP